MSSIEIASLIFVTLSVIEIFDVFSRVKKYRKTKDTKTYSQIKIGLYAILFSMPLLVYYTCTATDEVWRLAVLFMMTCEVLAIIKFVPIVLKEEMKKI